MRLVDIQFVITPGRCFIANLQPSMGMVMLLRVLILGLLMLIAAPALAFNIKIDRAGYTGTFEIVGQTPIASGTDEYDVAAGRYVFQLAPGNAFYINVDVSGKVTSENTDAAKPSGDDTLIFQTTAIHVLNGDYPGTYWIQGVNNQPLAGNRQFTVLKGLDGYTLAITYGNAMFFDVDAQGKINLRNPVNGMVNDDGDQRQLCT